MLLETSTTTAENGITVMELRGRMSLGNKLMDTETAIKNLIAQGTRKLLIDLTGLTFIDSAGLGAMLACAGAMEKAHGRIAFAGAQPKVAEIFALTHAERVLALFPDVAAALEGLS